MAINRVRLHLTEGDLLVLFRRSNAQHIIARIVDDARPQLQAQRNRDSSHPSPRGGR